MTVNRAALESPSCPGIYLTIYLSIYLSSPSCPGVPEKDLGRRDLTGVAQVFGWPVGQGSQSHPRTHGPPPARRSPRRRPRRTSPRRLRRGPRGSQQTRCEKREAGCAARGQSGGRRAGAGARSRGRGRPRGARIPQPASRARTGCSSGARGDCAASARFGNVPVEGGRPGSGEGPPALETLGRRAPRGGSPSGEARGPGRGREERRGPAGGGVGGNELRGGRWGAGRWAVAAEPPGARAGGRPAVSGWISGEDDGRYHPPTSACLLSPRSSPSRPLPGARSLPTQSCPRSCGPRARCAGSDVRTVFWVRLPAGG
ncbi:translation initiation factor IF-2-like isoform X1 [Orcinus orca]|uniref:translation initiation factor IF-2-like isoform X1 n=1 Tax=Orcinus orca TaxID=9733 RepID=UPI00211107BE|nr:translation initiation factor IF-2-like isoform X1 [Orcinus orca]